MTGTSAGGWRPGWSRSATIRRTRSVSSGLPRTSSTLLRASIATRIARPPSAPSTRVSAVAISEASTLRTGMVESWVPSPSSRLRAIASIRSTFSTVSVTTRVLVSGSASM